MEPAMSTDIVTEPYPESQKAVAARLEEIIDACRVKDFDRLAAYHLAGPKFSKFDDLEPLDRQDADTAMRAEVDAFSAIDDLDAEIENLKIDVFGPVAVATGVFRGTFRVGDEQQSASTRTTLVFVDNEGDWLLAHEHHSPFVASA
jgi:ketosteroid isomerase-like protein